MQNKGVEMLQNSLIGSQIKPFYTLLNCKLLQKNNSLKCHMAEMISEFKVVRSQVDDGRMVRREMKARKTAKRQITMRLLRMAMAGTHKVIRFAGNIV